MKRTIIFLIIYLFGGFVISNAQISISLRIDESVKSFAGRILFCDKNYNCGLNQNEQSKTSNSENKDISAKIWRTGKDFYLLIDTNQNNKLSDEKKILLGNNSKIIVKIKKTLASGKHLYLPFEISHQATEKEDSIFDNFKIVPHYMAVGTLSYKKCSSKISVADMNFDGKFSSIDADGGTNLQIDKNNDDKFWGKEEYHRTNEIIEFCGQNFVVASFSNTNLRMLPTDLQLAKLGKTVPTFTFFLLNGEKLSADSLKGENYILDFWASWCIPCIKNLPQINLLKKEYENRLSVFSVNVDKASRKKLAEKIINENEMFDFSVVRGFDNNDTLWKTFGGANLNNLSIPLYVLIDKNGIVRYANNGGKDLEELKNSLETYISNE